MVIISVLTDYGGQTDPFAYKNYPVQKWIGRNWKCNEVIIL